MAIIKLFTVENTRTSKLIKADTFEQLVEQAKLKFGPNVCRFMIKNDASEIDDDLVFGEMIQENPKGLELVVLRKGEDYEPSEEGCFSLLDETRSMNACTTPKSSDSITREWQARRGRISSEMESPSRDDGFYNRRMSGSILRTSNSDIDINNNDRNLFKEKAEQERIMLRMIELEESEMVRKEKEKTEALKKRYEDVKRKVASRESQENDSYEKNTVDSRAFNVKSSLSSKNISKEMQGKRSSLSGPRGGARSREDAKCSNESDEDDTCTPKDDELKSLHEESMKKELARQARIAKEIREMENSKALKSEAEKTFALKKRYEDLKRTQAETIPLAETQAKELEIKIAKLELSNHRIANLFKEFEKAERVDICFLLDCTGSMSSYINEAKTVIHQVTSRLAARFQSFALRFAFVGYRDHSDGDDRVTVMNFSDNADDFKTFVGSVKAKGGDDECEDVFGGLEEVLKLEWKHMSRLLLHIADAPCHGSRFHLSANDSHPGGDPRGLKIENLLKSLIDLNVSYYFTKINESTIMMINEFNEVIASLGGQKITVVDIKASDGLEETVFKSISRTIFTSKSKSLTSTHGKRQKAKKLCPLDWDISKFKKYDIIIYIPNDGLSLNKMNTAKISYKSFETELYMAPEPFAEGALRFAQAAYLVDPKNGRNKKCVIKESKFNDPKYNTRKYVEESIESQVMSIFLAKEFQKVSPSKRSMSFVDASYIKVKDTAAFYSVEEYMDGDFFKMSNNAGFIDEEVYSATLDAFSHWAYQITNEYLIVTDLQGTLNDTGYTLTDPAITCPDDPDRFSSTNLGRRGLKEILRTHKCNHICQRLKLLQHKYQESKDIRRITPKMTQMK